jgi:hypothetical protein
MGAHRTKRALRRFAAATRAAADEAPPGDPGGRPGYRVEHRVGDAVALVGYVLDGPAHHATLAPFIPGVLDAIGGEGELVLVDEATGAAVARRRLAPPVRR